MYNIIHVFETVMIGKRATFEKLSQHSIYIFLLLAGGEQVEAGQVRLDRGRREGPRRMEDKVHGLPKGLPFATMSFLDLKG